MISTKSIKLSKRLLRIVRNENTHWYKLRCAVDDGRTHKATGQSTRGRSKRREKLDFWVVAGNKLSNREGKRRRECLKLNHLLYIT